MNSKYEEMSLAELKAVAKEKGLKNISALRKHELMEQLMASEEQTAPEVTKEVKETLDKVLLVCGYFYKLKYKNKIDTAKKLIPKILAYLMRRFPVLRKI